MDRHRQLAMASPVSGDVVILQQQMDEVIYNDIKAFQSIVQLTNKVCYFLHMST